MTSATRRFAFLNRRGVRLTLKVLGGFAAIVVVGVIALALTFIPATLNVLNVEVGSLPAATPPAGMSISALPTGTYDTPAALAYSGGSWGEVRHFSSTAILVRHPRGNLLIDVGFGRNLDQHMQLIPAMQRSAHHKLTPVVDRLTAASMNPRDIAAIIPTHAHWDHISGIDDLRDVPVLETVPGRDWISSKAEGTEVMNSFGAVNYRQYDFDSGPYLGFPRSHDVWGDGAVVIVPAPGHTPDSVVVFVNLPSGNRYAFLGDLVWQLEGIEIPAEKPWMLRWLIGENNVEVHEDIARIRAAIKKFPQIHPIPAHDESAFRQIPTFPASAQ